MVAFGYLKKYQFFVLSVICIQSHFAPMQSFNSKGKEKNCPYYFDFFFCKRTLSKVYFIKNRSWRFFEQIYSKVHHRYIGRLRGLKLLVDFSMALNFLGILGVLEEYRDKVIDKLLTMLQSQMRRFLVKKNIARMLEQKKALTMLQKNLKHYLSLRTWKWLHLWKNIQPLLQVW